MPLSRRMVIAVLLAFVAGSSASLAPAEGAGRGADVIVILRGGARARVGATAAALGEDYGLAISEVYDTVMQGVAARVPNAKLARLRRDPRVAMVAPDRIYRINAETLPGGVDRIGADQATEGEPPANVSPGVPVAVLDTGIARHPDLNVAGGYNCTSRDRRAWSDGNGHGTHVAGIIGAKNNGRGIVGVAPNTPLYAVKVLNERGVGQESWAVCGLEWVVEHGITIVNMSFGARYPGDDRDICESSPEHIAICAAAAAGVRMVASAGNDGEDVNNFTPAKYAEVMAVSALADSDGCAGRHGEPTGWGADDTLAIFSNDGQHIAVAAPGVDIRSTWPGGRYKTLSGTSMAAPHVTGAIALGWSGDREAGPIPGDDDGIDEGILNLSAHTACHP